MHEHTSPMPSRSIFNGQRCGLVVAMLLCAIVLTPARATAGSDCAPMGTMPNFKPDDPPGQYTYESADMYVTNGDTSASYPIAGHYCRQIYSVNDSVEPPSVLETQSNYRDQLTKLGAQITFSDDNETDARLIKDGKTRWIKVTNNGPGDIEVIVVERQPFVQVLTAPSGNDYRLLGHMPQYAVDDRPTRRNFDQVSFTTQDGSDSREVNVQGTLFVTHYSLKPNAQASSVLDLQENYRTALKHLGAQIVFVGDDETDARYDNDGQPVWFKIDSNGEKDFKVSIIEEKAFQASLKPPQATELKQALDKTGHVAVYINFDFDKATLRADAAPIMAQVATLLKDNPALKLSIEGHTDNVGGHDYNVKLSQDRAAAVVAALTRSGITAGRLRSTGHGPDKPIADNATSEGRARNRRVELVKA